MWQINGNTSEADMKIISSIARVFKLHLKQHKGVLISNLADFLHDNGIYNCTEYLNQIINEKIDEIDSNEKDFTSNVAKASKEILEHLKEHYSQN